MTKYFFRWLAAAVLMGSTASAFATTATFAGTYRSYDAGMNYFPVRIGQQIDLTGVCSTKPLETLLRRDWTIDGVFEKGILDSQTGNKSKTFVVNGPADRQFNVKIQCMTGNPLSWYTNDAANRTFKVVASHPPKMTPDSGNALFTRDKITLNVHVVDTGDGIGEVSILWPDAPSRSEAMTNVSGDMYQYTIDANSLPEGPVAVQVWAASAYNANNGWESIPGFTVDRTVPTFGSASFSQAGDVIRVTVPVSDKVSGVENVWIRWETGNGWSSSYTLMKEDGASGKYTYEINTRGVPSHGNPVQIYARDKAGNETGWTGQGRFSVVHPAPTVAWDTNNAKFAGKEITIRAQAKAATGFTVAQTWIWWEGAPNSGYQMKRDSDGKYSYTIPTAKMPDGAAQRVMFWANDNDGTIMDWMTPAGSSFTVDHTAPAIAIKSAPTRKALRHDLNFVLDITDTGSQLDPAHPPQICWTQKDADGTQPDCKHPEHLIPSGGDYRFTLPVAGLHDGDLKVMFNAQDNLGNSHLLADGSWPDGPHFIIDKTKPVIDWRAPRDGTFFNGDSMHIAGTVNDDNPDYVTIEWQTENDTAWQSQTVHIGQGKVFEYDLPLLEQGIHYRIRMQAADQAGNLSELTPVRTIIGQLAADTLFNNPMLSIAAGSLVDKDDSGGFSGGDNAVYVLALKVGEIAAIDVSLRYALPAGLAMTAGTRPYFAAGSDVRDGGKFNAHWNGGDDTQLLADGVDLKANGQLLLHIPVTITRQLGGQPTISSIVSTVLATAKNAKDTLPLSHSLALQDKFPVHRALTMEMTSLQPDWKYAQDTIFDYQITVHVMDWGLTGFTLHYALPQGLETHGEVHIEGDGAATLALNPGWGKTGVKLLLSSASGAMLAARHSFTVIIPVKVSATAAGKVLRSDVEANASNLSGPVSAMHRIVLDGSGQDPEEQLTLTKSVDKKTALPGRTLRYTITYHNVGIDDLHDLMIRDTIQDAYLTLQNTQCGPINPSTIHCETVPIEHGELEWRLSGTLEAGDFGSVSYEVLINKK